MKKNMKSLLFLKVLSFTLILLVTTNAMSKRLYQPSVGDTVIYNVTLGSKDNSKEIMKFRRIATLVSMNKDNPVVKTFLDMGRNRPESEDERYGEFLASLLKAGAINDWMNNCTKKGGKIEKVKIKVATYKTCVVTEPIKDDESGEQYGKKTTWIGVVPFGLVKEVLEVDHAVQI